MSAYKLNSARILVWIHVLSYLYNGFENAPILQDPAGKCFFYRFTREKTSRSRLNFSRKRKRNIS